MPRIAKGDYREAYGYKFHWTDDHYDPERMRPLMFTYDVVATEALDAFDRIEAAKKETTAIADSAPENLAAANDRPDLQEKTQGEQPKQQPQAETKKGNWHRDLYSLLEKHHPEDETLSKLWADINSVPDWVDWDQIERGQKVFYRYAIPSIVSLTFQSLLGGMGSSRVAQTLSKTGGFSAKVARKRLLDTFQHVLDVTRESVKPGGKGWLSSVRVRLLHASVRRRLMGLAREDPSYYDMDKLGVPISDLDSIATIVTFSAAVIWVGYARQGIYLRQDEIEDYIALWRWIGFVMGVPDDVFTTPTKAKAMMESLAYYEIDPHNETSQALANNIITALHNQPPMFASEDFLRAESYWLNGSELASALAVPKPSPYYFALVMGQCFMFSAMCYIRRSISWLDNRNIAQMKQLLYKETMEQSKGKEATHGFKYIPRLGKTTVLDSAPTPDEEKQMYGEAVVARKATRKNKSFFDTDYTTENIEAGYLAAFLAASAVVGCVGLWFGKGVLVKGLMNMPKVKGVLGSMPNVKGLMTAVPNVLGR